MTTLLGLPAILWHLVFWVACLYRLLQCDGLERARHQRTM